MTDLMNVWQLQEYAKYNGGYKTGRFLCINADKGIFEMQWIDAFMGFFKFIQPEIAGAFVVDNLRSLFGDDQKYFATIGYELTKEE